MAGATTGAAMFHNPIPLAAYLGREYGSKLAQGEAWDPVGAKHAMDKMCRALWAAEDSGYLQRYVVCGIPCLGVAGLPGLDRVPQWPELEIAYERSPIMYNTTVKGSKVHIDKTQMAAFLFDNGVPVMTSSELEQQLGWELSKQFPLLHCRCNGKTSASGKTQTVTLEDGYLKNLKPGDARFSIRIDEDFNVYAKDPHMYEYKVKCVILAALGLDAKKIPGLIHHVKIEKVKQGSIEVVLVIGLVVLAVAAFVGFYSATPRPAPCRRAARHATVLVPNVPTASTQTPPMIRRTLSSMSIQSSSDGSFELVGHLTPVQKCYLRNSLFQKDYGEYIEAKRLSVDSEVLGISRGSSDVPKKLRVMSKVEHGPAMRELVTLHTDQSVLTITANHRVAIEGDDGLQTEAEAGTLSRGMYVFCGNRRKQLTRVNMWSSRVEAGICTCREIIGQHR